MIRKLTILLLTLMLPGFLLAQAGKISGTVTDQGTGEPLIGANILIVGTSFGAATDLNGEYDIRNLNAGVYEVRCSYVGFQTKTIANVRVNTGLTTEVDFQLAGEGFETEEIRVISERPLIQKDATNQTRITTSEDIDALPVRGVNNIIGLSAGVVLKDNNVFVRGGRLDEVGFYLEGVSITNPMFGGRAVRLSQDAIEEIQVQAGGYTAEFGGANAGIIRQQLKSGGPELRASVEYITDNLTFKGKDDFFDGEQSLGAYQYGYNEIIASVSGPLLDERFKFFLNFNYNYQKDQNPQPYPGIDIGPVVDFQSGDSLNLVFPAGPVYGNQRTDYTYAGTFNMDFKPLLFRFTGTYTGTVQDANPAQRADRSAGNVADFLNPRIGYLDQSNGSFSAKMTHVLNPNLFYEISGGYQFSTSERLDPYLQDDFWAYGDSVANAEAGVIWARSDKDLERMADYSASQRRYQTPFNYNVFGFEFRGVNDPPVNYAKNSRTQFNINAALQWMIGKVHSIKMGGEYKQYTLRNWTVGGQSSFAANVNQLMTDNTALSLEDARESTLITNGVNNYGYDVFGNETDEDGFFAPHKPVFFGAYIQDKIEMKDLILNVGLRYDYIDIDNLMFKDPAYPDAGVNKSSGELDMAGWEEVPTFDAVSPRLGFSFPVTDRTVFHAQYGRFIQQSRLIDAYQGYYRTGYELRGGFFIPSPVGKNIRPTKTTQYEVGFTQQITDFMSFDITGYYKDIKDQVVYVLQDVGANSAYQSYSTLGNGDFATTKGVEITLNMRRYKRLLMNATVAFQDAQGTGSFPNSNRGIVGAPLDGVTIFNPVYISPLEFNNAIRGNMNLDYRFGPDDGPVWAHSLGFSALLTYSGGHPFTRGVGAADLEGDARNRRPVEPLNASNTPSTFQVDLRIDKTFHIFDKLSANVYLNIINIFDSFNVENVFLRTGLPDDDGFISDPELSAQLTETYGQQYVDVYNALNIDYYEQYQQAWGTLATNPYIYGPPRQIRFGIRLEY